jgi:hypothetical protein
MIPLLSKPFLISLLAIVDCVSPSAFAMSLMKSCMCLGRRIIKICVSCFIATRVLLAFRVCHDINTSIMYTNIAKSLGSHQLEHLTLKAGTK